MEPGLFDRWTRRLAERRSRRSALGIAGAGAVTLLGIEAARAQDDDVGASEDGLCRMQFEATVRFGPSLESNEPFAISGLLAFKIGGGGGLSDASLTTEDGTFPMVGQASGKAIAMRITLNENETLIAVGGGESSVRSCFGEYGGPASGPIRGDLGDWVAFAQER
jgi:hypothetical protein